MFAMSGTWGLSQTSIACLTSLRRPCLSGLPTKTSIMRPTWTPALGCWKRIQISSWPTLVQDDIWILFEQPNAGVQVGLMIEVIVGSPLKQGRRREQKHPIEVCD